MININTLKRHSMSTVIQVVQHLSPGGIEVMALELKKINQKYSRVLILSLEGESNHAIAQWPRLKEMSDELIFMNKKPGIDPTLIPKLINLFKKEKATAIHTHHIGPLLYAGIAARLAGIKYRVHTEHDTWHLEDKKRRHVQKLALCLSNPQLTADASIVADSMRAHLNRHDIHIIKNGIDVSRFIPGNSSQARIKLQLPTDKVIVGSSGRLEEVKGHKVLIDAMSHLHKNIHLVIAGNGSLHDELIRQAKDLNLIDRIHFIGHIDDMPTFYQALDVFCLPSFLEGMPLAPLEAQACGIPAVITDTGGASEALSDDTGELVPPGNSEALSEALRTVLLRKKRISPRSFVETNGNAKVMAKAYAELCHIEPKIEGASIW